MHTECIRETSISTVKQFGEFGGYAMPMAMYTVAQRVFVTATSTSIKISADTGVWCDTQYIGEL